MKCYIVNLLFQGEPSQCIPVEDQLYVFSMRCCVFIRLPAAGLSATLMQNSI